MRRILATTASLVCLLALAACGDEDTPASGSSDPVTIEVTFSDGTVTPQGERVEVETGQDVELQITADAPGEIHVHSTPEQELEYAAGESTLTIANLDAPGVVDVESHTLDQVIVQLEVS